MTDIRNTISILNKTFVRYQDALFCWTDWRIALSLMLHVTRLKQNKFSLHWNQSKMVWNPIGIQDREFQMIASISKTQIINYAKYVLTGRLTGQIRIKKDPFRTTISFIFRIISACIILMQCFGRFNNKLSNLVASKLHYVKSRLRFPVWFATLHFLLNTFYCQKNKKDAETIYLI